MPVKIVNALVLPQWFLSLVSNGATYLVSNVMPFSLHRLRSIHTLRITDEWSLSWMRRSFWAFESYCPKSVITTQPCTTSLQRTGRKSLDPEHQMRKTCTKTNTECHLSYWQTPEENARLGLSTWLETSPLRITPTFVLCRSFLFWEYCESTNIIISTSFVILLIFIMKITIE